MAFADHRCSRMAVGQLEPYQGKGMGVRFPVGRPMSAFGAETQDRNRSRPCKNVLSDGGAEVETKRRTPRAQARIASINGLVPITAITRFIL